MADPDPAGLRLDLLWRLSDVLDRWISGYGDSTQGAHRLSRQNRYFAGILLTV